MSQASERPRSAAIWLAAIRPRTLSAGIAPVVVGSALAAADGVFHAPAALAALAGALAIQIGTNLHNDFEDHVRGADGPARVGPRRATAMGWLRPRQVLTAAIAAFALALAIGVYLVGRGGWPILALGLASVASGWAYTGGPRPLAYVGLGDLFVLAFFGVAAVVGTYYVQALTTCAPAWWLGVGVGALSTAILAVNNLRDRASDRAAGKRTLAVRLGAGAVRFEYALCLGVAYGVLVPVAGLGHPGALAAMASAPIAWRLNAAVGRTEGAGLNAVLGGTARLLAVYGALVGGGILVGGAL